MLTNYLYKVPPCKLVLLEDRLDVRCKEILKHLVKNHVKCGRIVHYFSCERNPKHIQEIYNSNLLKVHNVLTDTSEFLKLENINENSVIVIDSISLLLETIEKSELYARLNRLKQCTEILQILCVLHVDTIKDVATYSKQLQYLSNLSVEFLKHEEGYTSGRVLYMYRKSSGKIVKKYENLALVNDTLVSEPIKKLKVENLLESTEPDPETMSSFRIALGDKEKEERDRVTLPYLPKENQADVMYEMEEADDWDPEDPDDDLDF